MKRIKEVFRRYFFAGLFVLIPIALSVFFIIWFFKKVDSLFSPLVVAIMKALLPFMEVRHIPGTGFVLGIIIILIIGFLSKTFLMRKFLELVDAVMKKIPIAKSVYSTVKTLTEAFAPDNRTAFREVVLVKYPRTESYAIGFVTKRLTCGDEELDAVYVPTNNLYLGEVLFVNPEDILPTNLTVEEGIRVVASGGTAAPDCIEGPAEGENGGR